MFEEKIKNLESQINMEEKQYKSEIQRENELITKLNEELSILTLQLKEKEQEIRINELKLKELKRMSKHNQLAPINKSASSGEHAAHRSTSAKHNNSSNSKEVKHASQKYQSNENLPSKNIKYGKQNRVEKKKLSNKNDSANQEKLTQEIQNKEKILADLIKLKNETLLENPDNQERGEQNDEIRENTEV